MKRKYLTLFSLSGFILSLDQLTKHFVHSSLSLGESRDLIPGLVALTHARNSGFALGLLQKAPASLQEVFFIGVPVFAAILIVLIFIKLRDDQMRTSVALTTILAGAVGNLIDRVRYGYVLDVVDIHWMGAFHLPKANIADLSIVTGIVLMFLNTLHQEKHGKLSQT